jgi:hypothetical protein
MSGLELIFDIAIVSKIPVMFAPKKWQSYCHEWRLVN